MSYSYIKICVINKMNIVSDTGMGSSQVSTILYYTKLIKLPLTQADYFS